MIFDMWVHCTWKQGTLTWPCAVWRLFKFALWCLFYGILVDTVMAVCIFLQYRTSEAYVQWDPHAFQLHKTPTEITYTLLGCLVPWCYCFVITYVLSKNYLSYSCQAEILSRFLDVSFHSMKNSPINSAPVISATAPTSTTSSLAADVVEPLLLRTRTAAPASTTSTLAADVVEPLLLRARTAAPASTTSTLAADVVEPLLLNTGTAASESSSVEAAVNPYSARAIDHRVDAAYQTTAQNSETRSERDRSSNNVEGDIRGDDSSDSTEVMPFILTPQPRSRLELERPDLGMENWSAIKSINQIARNNSAASPTSKTSAAVGFRTRHNDWMSPIQAGSRIETPLQLSTAASSQGVEQASTPSRSPPKVSRRRQTQHKSTRRAPLRNDLASPQRDLGSPPAMRWPHSNPETLTPPVSAVSPKTTLPPHEFSPASLLIDEDPSWEASSRPITPVRGDNFTSPGSRAYSNGALNRNGAPSRSRITFKEILLTMMHNWRPSEDGQYLKDLIHYEDENNYRNTLDEIEIVREHKRYEHYARQKKLCGKRPFHIYGTEELFPLDCLKSWVKLYQHLNPSTPFPPNYKVITNESDAVSITGTLFTQSSQSQESDDYESTASESSKGKGKML